MWHGWELFVYPCLDHLYLVDSCIVMAVQKSMDGPSDPEDCITAAWHTQDLGQHFYPADCV